MGPTLKPRFLTAVGVVIFIAAAVPAHAVHKCTDPKSGRVSYSDTACPAVLTSTKMEWSPSARTNTIGAFIEGGQERVQRKPNADLKVAAEGAALLDVYKRWIDAERLSFSTARVALAGPVAALQELRRRAEATAVPECMRDARKALGKLIGTSVDVHLDFMSKSEGPSLIYQFKTRSDLIADFESAASTRC